MPITSFRRRQGYGGQAGAGRDSAVLPKRQNTNEMYKEPLLKVEKFYHYVKAVDHVGDKFADLSLTTQCIICTSRYAKVRLLLPYDKSKIGQKIYRRKNYQR